VSSRQNKIVRVGDRSGSRGRVQCVRLHDVLANNSAFDDVFAFHSFDIDPPRW